MTQTIKATFTEISLMKSDPTEALRCVKALSSPRRTGSPGEVQAQNYIVNRFKSMGMEPREEEFSFTPILGLLSKGFLFMVLLLITALHLLVPFWATHYATAQIESPSPGGRGKGEGDTLTLPSPLKGEGNSATTRTLGKWHYGPLPTNGLYTFLRMTVCLAILILSLTFLWGRPTVALLGWAFFKEIPFLQRLRSKNIIATWPLEDEPPLQSLQGEESRSHAKGGFAVANNLPTSTERNSGLLRFARNDGVKAHIYILAHYDSKSQTLPLGVRIPLVAILFLSTFFLSASHLLMPLIGMSVQEMPDRVSFITALTSGLVLLLTKTKNLSPGAIDNASGVTVMLQLAETIKKEAQRFKGLKFHFVATGAEEEGLVGAFWLCKSISSGDPSGCPYTFFINLDGVGTKGRIYCTDKLGLHPSSQKQEKFLSIIKETAERAGIKVYRPSVVIGAMADHFPFAAMGYSAVTFSTVSRRSLWVHSPWDTPEMVEAEGMEKVGKLILDILKSLKDFN